MSNLLEQMKIGQQIYTQLDYRVLAVLSRRVEGWCVYVGAVPGENHDKEWQQVASAGTKQREPVARAIVENLFFPGFKIGDLPYVI